MATFDAAKFRAIFPEFSDETAYPDARLQLYWNLAAIYIGPDWSPCSGLTGDQLDSAIYMLAAHLMTLGTRNQGGSSPGSDQGGFETSASIGDVSVSKLAPPAKDGWEWWLSQTPYGQMLWALFGLLSVGGTHVGGINERNSFRKAGGVFF